MIIVVKHVAIGWLTLLVCSAPTAKFGTGKARQTAHSVSQKGKNSRTAVEPRQQLDNANSSLQFQYTNIQQSILAVHQVEPPPSSTFKYIG